MSAQVLQPGIYADLGTRSQGKERAFANWGKPLGIFQNLSLITTMFNYGQLLSPPPPKKNQ